MLSCKHMLRWFRDRFACSYGQHHHPQSRRPGEGALALRAAQNGRSMEAEARSTLFDALAPSRAEPVSLAEAIRRRVAPLCGIELDEHTAVAIEEPVSFGR